MYPIQLLLLAVYSFRQTLCNKIFPLRTRKTPLKTHTRTIKTLYASVGTRAISNSNYEKPTMFIRRDLYPPMRGTKRQTHIRKREYAKHQPTRLLACSLCVQITVCALLCLNIATATRSRCYYVEQRQHQQQRKKIQ